MTIELKDKVVVITGGGRGLGRAMALELAARGAKLALVDLNEADLAESVRLCTEKDTEAKSYVCNVAKEDEVVALFDKIVADFGGVHGLVNNAGITRDALFVKVKEGKVVDKLSLEKWQQVLDVNLTGTFLCGREAAVKMIEAGTPGCIVNISSISKDGNMGQANYSATKSGVATLAVVWAKELSRYGIRAASVAPGFMGTEMVMSMKPEALEKISAGIPLKRIGDPNEIARTVAFIFENDYVTGRCFEIDGGLRL